MKKLNRYKITIFGAVLCSALLSCEKYLNVKSDMRLVVPNDLESLQQILDASQNMNFNICSYGEVAADDYFLTDETYNGFADELKNAYIWENYVYNFNNDWARAYYTVYNANLVLDRLNRVERTVDNRAAHDEVKGAALYFRATQYLSLVWTYAKAYDPNTADRDLGIVLRTSANFNDVSVRASVEQSYRAIITDLKEAEGLLPSRPSHVMRPSAAAAYGSLARTYLSMARYDSAYYYANAALEGNAVLLDFNENREINHNASYPFQLFNSEVIFYGELTANNAQIGERNLRVDTVLYDSYSVHDLRKELFFRANPDGYQSYRGSYSGSSRMFGGLGTNEMYLIRAECAARLGNTVEALADINQLLRHRLKRDTFEPVFLDRAHDVLDLVLNERRKELVFRGLRWIDVKRLNKAGSNIQIERRVGNRSYILAPDDNRFALPIPDDVVKLSGIPQNPI